jgi:hypothetical protein
MRNRPRPRITQEQIAEIRRLRSDGLKLHEIATRLAISINSACRHGKPTRAGLRMPIAASSGPANPAEYWSFIAPPSRERLMAGR